MAEEYKVMKNAETEYKIQEKLEYLPQFCKQYIISISGFTRPLTQFAYLQRIEFFFRWLHDYNAFFAKKDNISNFTIDELGLLKKADIEEFLYHISRYGAISKNKVEEIKKELKNSDLSAKERNAILTHSKASTRNNYKSALNSLFNFFCDEEYLESNPVERIRNTKEDKKVIIALDRDQQNRTLNVIECGSEHMSVRQDNCRQLTATRDKAIYILAMRTGIRVSELVSLDVRDLDFRNHCFKVILKRGDELTVYMDDSTEEALKDWLVSRELLMLPDNEQALFVSFRGSKIGSRLSVRSVELMVKKYATLGAPEIGYKVTPHKLRSTCATETIAATGDLNFTKNKLGHKSALTTTRYIKQDEDQKRERRNILDHK